MDRPDIAQQITFLYTRNLEETARFYEQIVGLPLALDQGNCRIYQVTDEAFIGFCERAETSTEPQGIILTLVTADVDPWHQYLDNQGVTFEKRPTLNPTYNIYHCFLRDPNGYLIEIQKFLDPSWS